jgi:hypothetical protein
VDGSLSKEFLAVSAISVDGDNSTRRNLMPVPMSGAHDMIEVELELWRCECWWGLIGADCLS